MRVFKIFFFLHNIYISMQIDQRLVAMSIVVLGVISISLAGFLWVTADDKDPDSPESIGSKVASVFGILLVMCAVGVFIIGKRDAEGKY